MGFLRKNIFWLFCALVVVGVFVFWAMWIREAAAANSKLDEKLERSLRHLKGIAREKGEIRTDAFIKSAEDYKKKLKDKAEELEKMFQEYQLRVEPIPNVEPPPIHDRTRFREWLTLRQDERCAVAASAGMRCERVDPVSHGDIPEGPIAEEEIPTRFRQYLISREIHRILAPMRVTIPCLKLSSAGEEEAEGTQERVVQELRRIEWMSEAEMRARRGGALRSTTTRRRRVRREKFPKPYNSFLFELELVAHFSLVSKVIQALETSKNFFFVVRRADTGRMLEETSSYESGARRGELEAGRHEDYKNQRYMEAPVRVVLECEVLEFDFSEDPDPLAPKEVNR